MHKIKVFENPEFGMLDVLIEEGKPLFPATDVAKVLGYSNPRDAVSTHCRYVVKRDVPHPQSPDKIIEKTFILESDLYRLVMRSKLPGAERFQDWVVDEVLPSIRRHGMYATDDTLDKMLDNPDFAIRLFTELKEEREKNKLLANKVEWLEPKATYCNVVLHSPNTIPTTTIAKDYGMSAYAFNQMLRRYGIQYKYTTTWYLGQKYADNGYTDTATYWHDGGCAVTMKWTQKGRMFLYNFLKEKGILPMCERQAS